MTALKTVEYAFPVLASLPDNTLTALTQITVYLPEDAKTFRSVLATVSADDIITATGGTIASYGMRVAVNGVVPGVTSNASAISNTGENISIQYQLDVTSQFTANWGTATSRTVDCDLIIDQSTGTTLGWVNVCVTLTITYEYDETSASHVKTVRIPLNAPVGALATSKPGSPTDTIPALDTFLPEASKTYRQINIVVQGNDQRTASGDSTLSIEIDTAGAQASGNHEGALATSRWLRRVFPGQSWDTSTTHSFYLWGSVAIYNHLQVWLEVTYEFDPASTTRVGVSVILPLELAQMGGTTSADYTRSSVPLWVEEPGTISDVRLAAYLTWVQVGPIAGLNMRLGTGSFVTYTDGGSFFAGGSGCMVRNDSAVTLARGRNDLVVDIYRTDATDIGSGLSGYVLVYYTADVPAGGVQDANHTTIWAKVAPLVVPGVTSFAIPSHFSNVPEAAYFVQGASIRTLLLGAPGQPFVLMATVSDELVNAADKAVHTYMAVQGDGEVGAYLFEIPATHTLDRWAGDPRESRARPITTLRFWAIAMSAATCRLSWSALLTYHSIVFEAQVTLYGAAAGTVDVRLHRAADGELLAEGSRSGSGALTLDWHDDTEEVYVVAVDAAGRGARSRDGLAGVDAFDVIFGAPRGIAA